MAQKVRISDKESVPFWSECQIERSIDFWSFQSHVLERSVSPISWGICSECKQSRPTPDRCCSEWPKSIGGDSINREREKGISYRIQCHVTFPHFIPCSTRIFLDWKTTQICCCFFWKTWRKKVRDVENDHVVLAVNLYYYECIRSLIMRLDRNIMIFGLWLTSIDHYEAYRFWRDVITPPQ